MFTLYGTIPFLVLQRFWLSCSLCRQVRSIPLGWFVKEKQSGECATGRIS